jgi:hypothetical protein
MNVMMNKKGYSSFDEVFHRVTCSFSEQFEEIAEASGALIWM